MKNNQYRAALVRTGEVINVITLDGSEYDPGKGIEIVKLGKTQFVDIGWTYDGEKFAPPEVSE